MNILSLFDGISSGQIALNRAGIQYTNYFASEIDKYAIKVTQTNFPNTIQLGDIRQIYGHNLPKIDLLLAGSPCTGFSNAGKQLNFEDPQSKLFFEFIRLLNETKPKYFLLENVNMKQEWQDVISSHLGVKPIKINSSLVSAQSRNRLYWTNIPISQLPNDRGILLKDVLEPDVDKKYFYSEKAISYLDRNMINKRFCSYKNDLKSKCIVANFQKSIPYNVYVDREKSHCITANFSKMDPRNYNKGQGQIVFENDSIRKLTPIECERLQTVPDNYTACVSDTQRYKCLGNGWTVDVIVHILKGILNDKIC